LNKICDAADWSLPELRRIITDEFAEVPRFHRKQWEFAVIYRELEQRGMLNGSSEGISFGSATEVMLYAVARRVKHLWATDLYGTDAVWDIARTDDATQFVKRGAPFAYPEDRLSAKAMDMRDISFPDGTFDFAYSSCAIEHIGGRDDFIRHLREVGRVLKPGGVYALTTEFTYAEQTVEMPGNYYFSRHALEEMVRESGLYCDAEFDMTLAYHRANTPLPVELASGVADGDGHFTEKLFGLMSVVQRNSATTPFTSCLVVLEKTYGGEFSGWRYKGWDQTRDFIDEGLVLMRGIVEDAEMRLPPFAWMPQRRSQYFLGHEHFFNGETRAPDPNTFFHTGYFWLGGKPRPIRVTLMMRAEGPYRIRLKVHRARGATPWIAELESCLDFDDAAECVFKEWMLEPDNDVVYAFVGEVLDGKVKLVDVSVTCAPSGAALLPVAS
jgi:SAM-dependent methyltransferase